MTGLRWGVVGTANIARAQFLPALRESGGEAVVVGSRDAGRAAQFASAHGVGRGVDSYEAVLEDPTVEAVYVPLPNPLHAPWTIRALEAGKAVLCEKPLCLDPDQVETVLSAARAADQPLWEAFVFPFQRQHERIVELVRDGAVGDLREVIGSFHFTVRRPDDLRLSKAQGGGALADVGVYPVRLAHELFGTEPARAVAVGVRGDEVEVEATAVLTYAGDRRLTLSCGFRRGYDTSTLLLGSEGTVRVDNPYHPLPAAALEVRRAGEDPVVEWPTQDAHSFTAALRHVTAAVRHEEAPRHTALESALPVARALQMAQKALGPEAP